MTAIKDLLAAKRTFILYAIIGVSGVLLDVLTFYLLYERVGLDKNIANTISTMLGITNNFLWNTFANFKVTDHLLQRYLRFVAVGIVGIILTALLFKVFVDALHFKATYVKLGSLLPVLIVQYLLNKYWTFKLKEA